MRDVRGRSGGPIGGGPPSGLVLIILVLALLIPGCERLYCEYIGVACYPFKERP